MKKTRVAVLIGPTFHFKEVTDPRDFLQNKDVKVHLVGLDDSTVQDKTGKHSLKPKKTINEISAADYHGLLIPGGGAPERIRLNEAALEFVRQFWQSGRPIGSICHGPQVLISAGVLKGVTLTATAGIRDDIQNAGGTFVDKEVHVDGQLVTSRSPQDLPAFNKAYLTALTKSFIDKNEQDLTPLSALKLAVSREKGAMEFYAAMADIAEEERVKNKFSYLSSVEKEHFDNLAKLFQEISGDNDLSIDLSANELGKHMAEPSITKEKAVQLAIDAEEKAYQFYRSAALKSKGKQIKELFEYLASEELEHKRLLLVDQAADPGGHGHFQWATHFDIPPGMDDMW